ncbi:glucose-6-phosphate isomerase [Buchnera aphidicola]|uniref:Glucose-6-phosphate isomerase n=1 Tax=Buchnera aphidicola (Anoecia oenotherae) TaxID=1241833 RepID=A0A4D6XYL0_9GAMM|nr:glucose-6-phosphate isomerase [Buchnera aphidicola]QCI19558.1 glucose-6-phosphate isomerase [Buchnera aphidicola (Anoecia oenotherae)]
MNTINPNETNSWKELSDHFKIISKIHIKNFFVKDTSRFKNFSLVFNNKMLVDFSKNNISKNTIKLLIQLSKEMGLEKSIKDMFSGEKINKTENQPVLHIALRNMSNNPILVDRQNVMIDIKNSLKKMKVFSNLVIKGKWTGYTNKKITDIVNIGIGGSHLGPNMVIESLQQYRNHLNIHFISNIDSCNILNILKKINFETTIFLISSKTFTTKETMTNAMTIKNIFLKKTKIKKSLEKHFFALTTNVQCAENFGISKNNIFRFWNWVGGRYSLWSSVGLSISLAIGYKNFISLLKGAYDMDVHFSSERLEKNIPVILALIGIWYNNFFNTETEAILPYNNYMHKFVEYLQQTNMESNGKNINKQGKKVSWQTGPIVWGGIGTNSQHAFYQLLHQGTKLIPCDFIIPINKTNEFQKHNIQLLANFLAQTKALAFGESSDVFEEDVNSNIQISNNKKLFSTFKNFDGNKPSNSIMLDILDPYNLGSLIALYEHKTFVQGVIFNVYSFDQWGVELGKKMANDIEKSLDSKNQFDLSFDSSTNGLIKFYNNV